MASANQRAGFSLVELTIGIALTAAMVLAVVATTSATTRAYEVHRAEQDLTMQAARVLDAVASEFADAELGSLVTAPSDSATYRRCTGWAGAAQFGEPTRVFFELDDRELADGLDNDGDGLVDEGKVVRIRDVGTPQEMRVVLTHNVAGLLDGEVADGDDDNDNGLIDERGLAFDVADDVLTIRIGLESLDPRGRRLSAVVETSVRIRN